MNKIKREITIEIIVGLFMFTVLIALGVFTIVLSRENLFKHSYRYEFVFDEIGGLRDGDNVYLRGMNVGRVSQTELREGKVFVYASLDVPLKLRRGYRIDITTSSMLGGKYLKVDEGPANAPEIGDNVTILGQPPIDIIDELGAAINNFKALIGSVEAGEGTLGKLLKDDSVYNNVNKATEDLAKIASRLEQGKGMLGHLLSEDDTVYNDVAATAASLKNITSSLESGKGTLGKLMTDDSVYNDGKALIANLRQVSDNLAAGKGTLGKLMAEDSKVYDDLEATLASVRSISEGISEGKGTLGKLVRDEKLYDEATSLVEDVRAAVDDLREASPITSFGSILFGAF